MPSSYYWTPAPSFLYSVVKSTEEQSPCSVEQGPRPMAKLAAAPSQNSNYGFWESEPLLKREGTIVYSKDGTPL